MSVAEIPLPDRRMARGLVCSALLHLLLALFLLRSHWPEPLPPPPTMLPIDLVSIAEDAAAPPGPKALPQLPAPKEPRIAPKLPPEPVDPLAEKLKRLSQWQNTDGAGISNLSAGNGHGADAGYGIKDYLRAQIERRWVPPDGALERNDWVVKLRVHIKEDGSVASLEILDDPRLTEDPAFREFAFSARNAALLSSPLRLPPQFAGQPRDVVLEFNPRRVQQ